MSYGRIARANRRYPDARRRAARYGQALRARRAVGLPPHLLPGVSGRDEPRGLGYAKFAIAGALVATLILVAGFAILVASTAAAVGGTVEAYKRVNANLPNAASIAAETFETTRIYDRNGILLLEVERPDAGGYRTFVTLDQISQYAIDATVAAEDATFWSHYGVEPLAILRGFVINVTGAGTSGGSTITQQLVRGLYPQQIGYDVTITRKFKEALAAIELDRQFSKQDILTMYLNQIFYGQRSYGIEAAANTYFKKHASELNLAEASLLAGLPQAPSFYDPTVRPDQAKKRQRYVLDQMVRYRYITEEEAEEAWNTPLRFQTRSGGIRHAPHFTIYVVQYLKELYGEDAYFKGGLQVYTTLDVELQARAEEILRRNLAAYGTPYQRNNAAMVAMVPWSGEILAMVGSADFHDPYIGGQVNYALAPRQPGSSIKPVVYAAAFERGWNPGTIIFDTTFREPTPGAPEPYYQPQNYTGLFYGAVSVRSALANSLNIPAVKAGKFAGIDHVYELAKRMGFRKGLEQPWYNYGLSFSLGSAEVPLLEHTNVYATFANNGRYVPANPIRRIEDSRGNVLYDIEEALKANPGQQVLRAEYAYQITSILTDAEARAMVFGRGNRFENTADALGRPVAAKSGTSDGWRDIWTMGYATDLAVGVWVGRTSATGQDPLQLPPLDGIEGAGPIWQDMMIELHQNPKWSRYLLGPNGGPLPEEFPRPPGIERRSICVATGHRATGAGATREEWLVRGEGPALRCDQVSAEELAELQFALQDIRQNGGKYTGRAIESIYQYASAVGLAGGSRPSGNRSGGSSGSSSDGQSGDSPRIQPRSGQ